MKICGISDIHGNLVSSIPTCNVLCICGDIIPLNIQRDPIRSKHWWLERFCKWVKELPCEKVIFTAGNHDFFLESLYKGAFPYMTYSEFLQQLKDNSNNKAVLLIDSFYSHKGVRFYGFPYIRPIGFQEGKWAFEDDYKGMKFPSIYDHLSSVQTDILITHDNPYNNILLGTSVSNNKTPPKYHLYGHWHDGISQPDKNKYNCSILNDYYNFKKDFVIPEIVMETKKEIIEEVFDMLLNNISMYTALKGYNSTQIEVIKEYITLNRDFFLRDKEDDIPLPITGNVIEEDEKDED